MGLGRIDVYGARAVARYVHTGGMGRALRADLPGGPRAADPRMGRVDQHAVGRGGRLELDC